jgi:glycosyltransferase involved in cell wall biosynthesis
MTHQSQPLRLLYLTQCRLSRELGGSKPQLALADHIASLGWHVDCRASLDPADGDQRVLLAGYDVVDWDPSHAILRARLPTHSLSVCRFPLLALHFAEGSPWPLPLRRRFDPILDPLRRWRGRLTPRAFEHQAVSQARAALACTDAVAVQNSGDDACLQQLGVDPASIIVEPSGLTEAEFQQLGHLPAGEDGRPILSFVGTFDYRKGCLDLAWLTPRLARRFPSLQFRFIGTNGLIQGERSVRAFFPHWLQSRLQVVPSFPSGSLPQQLNGVTLGVFPSYLEGFGIAVIEQLAAGIPVVAYNSPGPADILPADWLVPRGNRQALLERLSALLGTQQHGDRADAERARRIAAPYRWARIAARWDGHYRRLLAARRP